MIYVFRHIPIKSCILDPLLNN